ncbi:MAG: DUF423 domain-containing protein [Planctomycetota bacterium]
MKPSWITAGALVGFAAVAAGSFGAHLLETRLEETGQAANWETAVRYALAHALALVLVGLLGRLPHAPGAPLSAAGWCFLLGTAIFSGCLAVLALSGLRWLGAIVPIGGVLMLAGWLALAIAGLTRGD